MEQSAASTTSPLSERPPAPEMQHCEREIAEAEDACGRGIGR